MLDETAPTYEYRRFSRVPVVVPGSLRFDGSDSLEGKTRNVSANGLCVESDPLLPLGGQCTVKIDLSDGKQIELRGAVVRIERGAQGIEVEAIKDGAMEHLRELILSHADFPEQLDTEMVSRANFLPETY